VEAINQGVVYLHIEKDCPDNQKNIVIRKAIEHHYYIKENDRLEKQLVLYNKLKGLHKLTVFLTDFVCDKINPVFSFVGSFDSKINKLAQVAPEILPLIKNDKYFGEFKELSMNQLKILNETLRKIGNDMGYVLSETSEHTSVDIKKMLANIIQSKTEQGQVVTSVTVGIEKDIHSIKLPVGRFEYIFSELLDNSIRHFNDSSTHDHTITIDVQMGVFENKHAIIFKFSDNGPGMDKTVIDKLFHEPVTTRMDRAGLGLFNVAHIIKDLAGDVDFVSSKDRGTTIVLKVPVVD